MVAARGAFDPSVEAASVLAVEGNLLALAAWVVGVRNLGAADLDMVAPLELVDFGS